MSKFAKYFVGISLVVLSGVGMSSAQDAGTALKVSIPQSFVVRDKVLPAGDYTLRRMENKAGGSSVLVLQGNGEGVLFDTIATSSPTAAKDTKLIFEKADNRLFLSEIWIKGETVGKQLVGVKAEMNRFAKTKAAKAKGDTTGF